MKSTLGACRAMEGLDNLLGHGVVPVVLAAQQGGLLDELDAGPGSAEELAARRGLNPRATQLLLDALAGLSVCIRDERGVYRRLDGVERGMPWSLLPRFLATGEVGPWIDGAMRGETYARLVGMLGQRFAPWARSLAAVLPVVEQILDVGAGSGIWSLAMAERSSKTQVTGLDLPAVLPRFLEEAQLRGLGDRVQTIGGSYFDVEVGREFDRVLLANVLHLETSRDASRLVDRCARLLAPGGELVIVDCVGEGEAHEPWRSFYALHLGLRTARGGVHSVADLTSWCGHAGLARTRVVTLDVPAMGAIVATR